MPRSRLVQNAANSLFYAALCYTSMHGQCGAIIMSKSAPPIRISRELYDAAELAGQVEQRSSAKQIEHWARIGRLAAKTLSGNDLLAITSGVAETTARYHSAAGSDPDRVFAALESDRESGQLSERVTSGGMRYQASPSHPGLLERIDGEGRRVIGSFTDGKFVPHTVENNRQANLGRS